MTSRSEQLERLCDDFRTIVRSGAKEEVSLELQRILESRHFRTSHRSCIFLKYVVEKALAGQFDAVKERLLGVELFGRDSLFNTDHDSVVRVAANDVRRRLAEYYREGSGSRVRIELLPGVYVPQVQLMAVEHPEAPVPIPQPAWWHGLANRRKIALVVVSLCLAGALWGILRGLPWSAAAPPARRLLPWSALLKPGKGIGLVLADANLVYAKLSAGRDIPIGTYADHSFAYGQGLSGAGGAYLNFTPLTPLSDAVLATRISALVARSGSETQIKYCNRFSSSELKGEQPLVFLGSATSNPWVELLENQLNFQVVGRYDINGEVCLNRQPRAGERSQYDTISRASGLSEGYAVIALLRNLSGKAPLLMIAGTCTEATQAAGEFVTDLDRLAEMMKRLNLRPGADPQHLELLLRISFLSANAASADLVAFRVK